MQSGRRDTYETSVHFAVLVTGAEHLVVQLENDVFEFVPYVAHAIVQNGYVHFLQQVGARFTCTKNTQHKALVIRALNRVMNASRQASQRAPKIEKSHASASEEKAPK